MKKITLILSAAFISLIISGCTASNSSRSEYFGYNNSPKPEDNAQEQFSAKVEPAATEKSEKEWVNPLSSEGVSSAEKKPEAVTREVYYVYSHPMYVPVVTPWWSDYYWGNPYAHPGIYIYYSNYRYAPWSYAWYAPWYSYDPFWGVRYAHRPYYYSHWCGYSHWGYSHWHNYGYYPTQKQQEKSVRTFGPGRGSLTSNDQAQSAGSRGSSRYSGSNSPSGTQGTVPGYSNTEKSSGYSPVRSSGRTSGTSYTPSQQQGSSESRYAPVRSSGRSSESTSSPTPSRSSEPSYTPPRSSGRSSESTSSPTPSRSNESTSTPSRSSGRSSESTSSPTPSRSSEPSYTPPARSSGSSSSGSSSGSSSSGSSSSGSSSSGSSSGSSNSRGSSRR